MENAVELGLEVLVVCGFESYLCHSFFCFFLPATSLFRNLLDVRRILGTLGEY